MSPEEARRLFSQYPLHKAGPPVIYPQLPATAIYHNRAVWPFVTAYAIKAAASVGHAPFVSESMQSLWNGAALNLSHMENLEFLSGLPYVADGTNSGPVVNSRRQLWSVAAFVSMIIDTMFGLEAAADELHIHPFLTQKIAEQWMPEGRITLHDLSWRGKRLQITMQWPKTTGSQDGFFRVMRLRINGQEISGSSINFSQLNADNQVQIDLAADAERWPLTVHQPKVGLGPALSPDEYKKVFAPMEPRLKWVDSSTIGIDRREMNATQWDLYRNGRLLTTNIREDTWRVPGEGCYLAIQTYLDGTLSSHPSPELCQLGWNREFWVPKDLVSLDGASQRSDHGRIHFNDWGRPDQVLQMDDVRVPDDGHYRVEVAFGNAFGPINTGITAAVKWVEAIDIKTGDTQGAAVFMPHQINWETWSWSSSAGLNLKSDRSYRLRLADARNMSYFAHFERYTAGPGGVNGVVNRANISGMRLRRAD
ncbi:MAG: hypothetical protein M3Q07_23510 [Pseudobdellovibrionaceae bacterium]|nr:hypothetical protein [Pseudobdellovibrionaceae bacterium]